MGEKIAIKPGRGGARPGSGRKKLSADPRIVEGWYVYAITERPCSGFLKIGIANKPYSRMATAQTSNPRLLVFSGLWSLGASDVNAAVEKALHRALRPFHARGEWFEIDVPSVERHLNEVAESLGVDAKRVM